MTSALLPDLDPRLRLAYRAVFAASIVLVPLLLFVGNLFNPATGGVGQGASAIAQNAAADPATNELHLAAFFALSFLLPVSVIGLTVLALPRAPWLATIGGGLGLIGWLPWAALAAQDDLTYRMAVLGGGDRLVDLWNRFTTDPTMLGFLLVYVLGHLVAYVVLALALYRAGVIPGWAAWATGLTSPATVVGFASREHAWIYVAIALWLIGSLPAAAAAWGGSSARGRR